MAIVKAHELKKLRQQKETEDNLEALLARIRMFEPLDARIERCKNMIGDMCAVGRGPKMSIPVQWDDEDLFIITTFNDAQNKIEDLEEKVKRLEEDLLVKNTKIAKMAESMSEALKFINDASYYLDEDNLDD